MECRVHNFPTKRVFGRDITNLDQRRPKAASITEKPQAPDSRPRALSTARPTEPKQATTDYEADIMGHLLALQRREREEILAAVTGEMRAILIDWLVDVHASF